MKMLNYFVVYAIRANIKNKLAEKWNKDNDIIELKDFKSVKREQMALRSIPGAMCPGVNELYFHL